jgi:methylated-DNA-[protein]-cysteine S-methyltransferase
MTFFLDRIPSPVGTLSLVTTQSAIVALDFDDYSERMHRLLRIHYGDDVRVRSEREPLGAGAALEAYFAGDLHALDALPVQTNGTPFQKTVWDALRTIAPGTTLSYGALAKQIGKPLASRAVGLANGANPIAIVVPCHRVIGANGTLTGFGGGLPRKRWLLAHEGSELQLL